MKTSSIHIINVFLRAKSKSILQKVFDKLRLVALNNEIELNKKMRNSIRIMNRIFRRKKQQVFNRLRDSRFIKLQINKCVVIFRILKQCYYRNIKTATFRLRNNAINTRTSDLRQQIKDIDEKLINNVDEDLDVLK